MRPTKARAGACLRVDQLFLPVRVEKTAPSVFAERLPGEMIEKGLQEIALHCFLEPGIAAFEISSLQRVLQIRLAGTYSAPKIEFPRLGGGLNESGC